MTAEFKFIKDMPKRLKHIIAYFARLGLCALILSTLLVPATARAQNEPTAQAGLQVESRDGTLHLEWQGSVQAASTGAAATPTSTYGGYLLPLETLMIEVPAGQTAESVMAAVSVQGMSSSPYSGELTLAPQEQPPALDYVPSPTNQPYVEEAHLPSSPLFVMAEGMQRNRHLAVLGFSPIYQDPNTGEILSVESFAATIAGATVAESDPTVAPNNDSYFAPVAALATASAPTNPLANTNAYKILVSEIGMQQISGAELAAAGLASPQASKLRLFHKGVEIPLHLIDGNNNNVLDSGDYLRFYAHSAGDSWNAQEVYWLTTGSQDGLRMASRTVAPAGATARSTAYEVGRHQENSIYETTLAGADGDNWFQANLVADGAEAKFDLTLAHQLPLNGALPTLLTLNITPYSIGTYDLSVLHRLRLSAGDFNETSSLHAAFTGAKPFEDIVLDLSLNKAADSWRVTLLKEATGRAIMFDAVDYLLPVQLNFGGKGAIFQGIDGTWRYQLTNTPTSVTGGRSLYDITNPALPQRLSIPGGANFEIQDGPEARRYLMTGPGTLFTPEIVAHAAVNLGGKSAAHIVYIAPKEFHTTLQPLIDHRKSQGYQARVIDVQAIYDSWSFGMVDAKAIRNFLRFAAGNWSPAPVAAVLVGDTTYDPHNYLKFDDPNPNVIPPYIANVDPWLKYVPCESCFGQLDGDDPAEDYLIDIWIGRFPVIDTVELNIVVQKIISYETDTDLHAQWRTTSLQVADDDIRPDNTVDTAGPFVSSAEHAVSLMPERVRQLRNYFFAATDLSAAPGDLVTVLNSVKAWFVDDPDEAVRRTISLMNSGVGIVTYTGHGNHWQWARITTEDNKWIFGLWDVLRLNNRKSPFISMSMTCYTSQFHKPETRHFTLDEHLLLHGNGGAISTWGPTGFSIVPAHDTLQVGFHTLLWKSPRFQAKLGALTEAGYLEVFSTGKNLDVTKTFAFLGDPLTPARIAPVDSIYMPKLERQVQPVN